MNKIQKTLMVAALLASGNVLAANAAATDSDRAQYDAERARCMSGSTGQTQASCLKSAGAAYDASRAGKLNNPSTDYRADAMRRCAVLPPSDRPACELRVDDGVHNSSVKGGGDLKETITVTSAPAPGAATR